MQDLMEETKALRAKAIATGLPQLWENGPGGMPHLVYKSGTVMKFAKVEEAREAIKATLAHRDGRTTSQPIRLADYQIARAVHSVLHEVR